MTTVRITTGDLKKITSVATGRDEGELMTAIRSRATPATSSSCASCGANVSKEQPRFAPIGPNDAAVRICYRCDEGVIPDPDPVPQGMRRLQLQRFESSGSDRATQLRRHRDELKREGICVNGRTHGAAEPGHTTCTSCRDRMQRRNRRVSGERAAEAVDDKDAP